MRRNKFNGIEKLEQPQKKKQEKPKKSSSI